jgi:hypothetical protein
LVINKFFLYMVNNLLADFNYACKDVKSRMPGRLLLQFRGSLGIELAGMPTSRRERMPRVFKVMSRVGVLVPG